MTLNVFTDGSGNGVYGFLVKRGTDIIKEENGPIHAEVVSNNVSEYYALIKALEWLKASGFESLEVSVHSDSMLVVEQMRGNWRIKDGAYVDFYAKAREVANGFSSITFTWIPRQKNKSADSLTRGRRARHELPIYSRSSIR